MQFTCNFCDKHWIAVNDLYNLVMTGTVFENGVKVGMGFTSEKESDALDKQVADIMVGVLSNKEDRSK
jgi:hypothetical protein